MWELRSNGPELTHLLFNTLPDLSSYVANHGIGQRFEVQFIPVWEKPVPKRAAVPPDEIEPKTGMGEFPIPLSRLKE